MTNTDADFGRLNDLADQSAPQPHHGPGPGTIAAVGGLLWLGAREYNYRKAIAEGRIPEGWKRSAWGWYILLAAVVHLVVFVGWYANSIYGDDLFWSMLLMTGVVVWGVIMLLAIVHNDRIERHNAELLNANTPK